MTKNYVRNYLRARGMPEDLITAAIPPFFFYVGTTDPDAVGVRALAAGVQQALGLPRTGVIDRATADALDRLIPPAGTFFNKTWMQVYFALEKLQRPSMNYLIQATPRPMGLGETAADAGVALVFGQGISNPQNIVPVPKGSGVTYGVFSGLQRQINRMLSIAKAPPVAEDGIIGASTLAGYLKAKAMIPAGIIGGIVSALTPVRTTLDLARRAASEAKALGKAADDKGVAAGANKGSIISQASASEAAMPSLPASTAKLGTSAAGMLSPELMETLREYGPYLGLAAGVAIVAVLAKRKGKARA